MSRWLSLSFDWLYKQEIPVWNRRFAIPTSDRRATRRCPRCLSQIGSIYLLAQIRGCWSWPSISNVTLLGEYRRKEVVFVIVKQSDVLQLRIFVFKLLAFKGWKFCVMNYGFTIFIIYKGKHELNLQYICINWKLIGMLWEYKLLLLISTR